MYKTVWDDSLNSREIDKIEETNFETNITMVSGTENSYNNFFYMRVLSFIRQTSQKINFKFKLFIMFQKIIVCIIFSRSLLLVYFVV